MGWSIEELDVRAVHSASARILEISSPGLNHLDSASVTAMIEILCRENVLFCFGNLIDDMARNDRKSFTTSEGYQDGRQARPCGRDAGIIGANASGYTSHGMILDKICEYIFCIRCWMGKWISLSMAACEEDEI